jgi:hypothetical protein
MEYARFDGRSIVCSSSAYMGRKLTYRSRGCPVCDDDGRCYWLRSKSGIEGCRSGADVQSGGVSDVFRVGSGTTDCTLRSTQTDFMYVHCDTAKHVLIYRFYLNETSVSQCNPVEVYWDATAVSPVRVIGVIPQGQIFEFSSIGAATSMSKSHPAGEELTKQPGLQISLLVPRSSLPHSILDRMEMAVHQP